VKLTTYTSRANKVIVAALVGQSPSFIGTTFRLFPGCDGGSPLPIKNTHTNTYHIQTFKFTKPLVLAKNNCSYMYLYSLPQALM